MTPEFTLITGASSGIGRATAIRLSASRNLILHGRDTARLDDCRQRCSDPERHVIWSFDLARADQIEAGLADILGTTGRRVENVVHCAGVAKAAPARALFVKSITDTMAINFVAAAMIVTTLLKKRINDDALRRVVFLSSIWSKFGEKNHSVYCASKGALDSFMRALAVELAPTVRVNSILPGAVETPLSSKRFDDPTLCKEMSAQYPLGTGQPDDVGSVVEFILSEQARWMTGQQIIVDGGWSCH